VLVEHALYGGGWDAITAGDLAEALAAAAVATDGGMVEIERLPSDVPAFELGLPHACPHPLDDQAAFQLSDGADDDDDSPAQRAAGVDLFAEADELDVEPVQFIQDFQEVLGRPGDPVRSPDQDDIEPAAAGIPQQAIETGAARLRAADPVRILFDDLIAALAGHLLEIVELGFRMLVDSADPHIEGGPLHGRRRLAFGACFVTYCSMNFNRTSVMLSFW